MPSHARVEPLDELVARAPQADDRGRGAPRARARRAARRRAARPVSSMHLERAHDAAAVAAGPIARGRVRVDGAQPRVAARPGPCSASSASSSRAERRRRVAGTGSRRCTLDTYSPEPPTRIAYGAAGDGSRRSRRGRPPGTTATRRLLGDVEHVEQVVRDAAALVDRELRRADVHAAVQLHRVGVDDLGGASRARRAPRRGRATRSDLPVPVAPTIATSARQRCESPGRSSASADVGAAGQSRRAASAGRATRGRSPDAAGGRDARRTRPAARSHASPARVRRMRSGAPSSESASRWNGAAWVIDDRDDVAGARQRRSPRAPRSARAGCLRRGRSGGASRHPSCPRPWRRAPRPRGRRAAGSLRSEMRSCSAMRRS